jgi:hypothetical protein
MDQTELKYEPGYAMSEDAWLRLRESAAAMCTKVWRLGGRMFVQRPGEKPEEFRCDTLHSAGLIRCSRQRSGLKCEADANHVQLGGRLVCGACGNKTRWLTPEAIALAAQGLQPASQAQ